MRLKVKKVEDGLHPSQVSVSINAQDGLHYLVINRHSLDASDMIEVGNPVGRREVFRLIELPAETDSGVWRVWVNKDELSAESALEAAE
jgi:hypothetical protein